MFPIKSKASKKRIQKNPPIKRQKKTVQGVHTPHSTRFLRLNGPNFKVPEDLLAAAPNIILTSPHKFNVLKIN